MTHRKHLKFFGTAAAIAVVLSLALANSPKGKAAGGADDNESKIQRGLDIAPVPLNLKEEPGSGGTRSYLVNAVGDCNGCHHATLSASSPYTPTGDPYQGLPKQVEQGGYLAGGTPLFGPFFIPAI
jgi:hypothetical protein